MSRKTACVVSGASLNSELHSDERLLIWSGWFWSGARLSSFEDDVPYVELGFLFDYMPDSDFSPYASVAFWSDLGDDGVDLVGTTGGFPFTREVEDVMSHAIEAEIGFDWTLSERASLNAGVKYFSASEADGFAFVIGTDFSF